MQFRVQWLQYYGPTAEALGAGKRDGLPACQVLRGFRHGFSLSVVKICPKGGARRVTSAFSTFGAISHRERCSDCTVSAPCKCHQTRTSACISERDGAPETRICTGFWANWHAGKTISRRPFQVSTGWMAVFSNRMPDLPSKYKMLWFAVDRHHRQRYFCICGCKQTVTLSPNCSPHKTEKPAVQKSPRFSVHCKT